MARLAASLVHLCLVCLASSGAIGCASGTIPRDAKPHGNFSAVLARGYAQRDATPSNDAGPVLFFSDAEVVAIDPVDATRRWRKPLRIHGEPGSFGTTVVVPVRGNELVRLDAQTGAIAWKLQLPGEAFTGISVGDRFAVATTVTGRDAPRALVAGISLPEGRPRWTRKGLQLFGVPAMLGNYALVPLEDHVVALSARTGREVARLQAPTVLDRVEVHGDTVIATNAHTFVDLFAGGKTTHALRSDEAEAFRAVEGLDPGVGQSDGLAWRIVDPDTPDGPREAVFLGRRAVIALRLTPDGRPLAPRWVHLRYEQTEMVGLHVRDGIVLAVDESGRLSHLDMRTGRPLRHIVTDIPARTTLLVGGLARVPRPDEARPPRHEDVIAALVGLIEEPDARLLPAQRLAVELLWNDPDPQTRSLVAQVEHGMIRDGDDLPSVALRDHARIVHEGPWGAATVESVSAQIEQLEMPAATAARGELLDTIRKTVEFGGPGTIRALINLLDDPALEAEALVEVTRALRDLNSAQAVDATAEFVLRYHADRAVVEESLAVFYGLELLVARAFPSAVTPDDAPSIERARETLSTLLDDEFTVPSIRSFVLERVEDPRVLQAPLPKAAAASPSAR